MQSRVLGLVFVIIGINACSYDKMSDFGDSLSKVSIADDSNTPDTTSTEGDPRAFKSTYDMYKNKGYSDSDAYKIAYAINSDNNTIPNTSEVPKPK